VATFSSPIESSGSGGDKRLRVPELFCNTRGLKGN
jgi:hypothetical protein